MDEVQLSNLVVGVGATLIVAGITYLFHEALFVQRGRRGRMFATFDFKRLSVRTIGLGIAAIAIGVVLVGAGEWMLG